MSNTYHLALQRIHLWLLPESTCYLRLPIASLLLEVSSLGELVDRRYLSPVADTVAQVHQGRKDVGDVQLKASLEEVSFGSIIIRRGMKYLAVYLGAFANP